MAFQYLSKKTSRLENDSSIDPLNAGISDASDYENLLTAELTAEEISKICAGQE